MSRELPTGFSEQTEAPVVRPFLMTEIEWPDGAVRAWSGYGTLTVFGQDFAGVGDFGAVAPVGESSDLAANGVNLALSGVPSDLLAKALANDSQGRPAQIWLGMLAADGSMPCEPYRIFSGFVDVCVVEDTGAESTIVVSLEKELIDRRLQSRRSTHEDQQIDHPGDDFFQYVAGLQDKPINWGGKTATPAGWGTGGSAMQLDYSRPNTDFT